MEMSEKQRMLNMLKDLNQAIENLHHQIGHQDQFLRNMFRDYTGYGHNTYQLISNVRNGIQHLEQMMLSNADNAHRLSPSEEAAEVRYAQGNYPGF